MRLRSTCSSAKCCCQADRGSFKALTSFSDKREIGRLKSALAEGAFKLSGVISGVISGIAGIFLLDGNKLLLDGEVLLLNREVLLLNRYSDFNHSFMGPG